MILILEDDAERVERFTLALGRVCPREDLRIWNDANRMVQEAGVYLSQAKLISLDHDLVPESEAHPDPGDGLQVVKFLVQHRQPCPVIIHTSNATASLWMKGEFELADWEYHSIAPLGDDWIEADWQTEVARLFSL